MEANMQHREDPLLRPDEGVNGSCMVDLAILLRQCGTSEYNSRELISFVDDIDEDTGEVTTVKVVL